MRKSDTIAAMLALALLTVGAAGAGAATPARDACREDAARLCSDVTPGKGRILKCLAGHREELSPACRDALAQLRERHREPGKTPAP